MVFPFPSFHGLNEEDAGDFCNNFELACLLAKYNDSVILKAFPLVIKGKQESGTMALASSSKRIGLPLKMPFLISLSLRSLQRNSWKGWSGFSKMRYVAIVLMRKTFWHF